MRSKIKKTREALLELKSNIIFNDINLEEIFKVAKVKYTLSKNIEVLIKPFNGTKNFYYISKLAQNYHKQYQIFTVYCCDFDQDTIAMPHVSNKRKALSELNRKKSYKEAENRP